MDPTAQKCFSLCLSSGVRHRDKLHWAEPEPLETRRKLEIQRTNRCATYTFHVEPLFWDWFLNHNVQHCLQNDQLGTSGCKMDVQRAVVAIWYDFDGCIYFLFKGTVAACFGIVCSYLNGTDNYILHPDHWNWGRRQNIFSVGVY